MSRIFASVCVFLTCAWLVCTPCLVAAVETATAPEAATPAPRDFDWWKQRNDKLNERAKTEQWELAFLGDSITQGWEGHGKDLWEKHYGDRKAVNLGFSGDETQHLVHRIQNGNLAGQSPKLAVVMIGTNNLGNAKHSPADVIEGISLLLDTLKEQTPETQVLVLGVFPRGEAKDDPYREQIRGVNKGVSDLVDWETTHFLDIGHVFLEEDGTLSKKIMPDALHLSEEGYKLWAEAIEAKVAELLGEKVDDRQSLFDGKSLKGWTDEDGESPPKGWGVKSGNLAVTGWGEDAFTTQMFGDFDFQVEWKIPRKGNGGIFYRVADYRYIWLGPEYQLVDDFTRRYKPGDNGSVASSVDLYGPAASKPVRSHGAWNHTRIVVEGDQVEHWLNGMRVLSYTFNSDDWSERVQDSKFSRLHPYFGQPARGKFKLQNHFGSRVMYRDLVVREL